MNPLQVIRDLIKNEKPVTRGVLSKISGNKAIVSTNEGTQVVQINTNEIRPGVQVDVESGLVTQRNKVETTLVSHQL